MLDVGRVTHYWFDWRDLSTPRLAIFSPAM
jgi:hypothetical protein